MLATQPLGILLAKEGPCSTLCKWVMKEEKGKEKWMAADLLFCFPPFHLGTSPSLSRELKVCSGELNVHTIHGHPLPKALANSKATSKLHFLFKAP